MKRVDRLLFAAAVVIIPAAGAAQPREHVSSLGARQSVSVLEQNFDFDLLDPPALINRYVGCSAARTARLARLLPQ
ncbi:MAG TPA: hypothetical protein VKT72_01020 [Candidatus Baltobacteraceae bacterium]|nr:hypothetical protein [Candidatus Baltobacteraceae bacterium]